jgi:hypothetical protein
MVWYGKDSMGGVTDKIYVPGIDEIYRPSSSVATTPSTGSSGSDSSVSTLRPSDYVNYNSNISLFLNQAFADISSHNLDLAVKQNLIFWKNTFIHYNLSMVNIWNLDESELINLLADIRLCTLQTELTGVNMFGFNLNTLIDRRVSMIKGWENLVAARIEVRKLAVNL